MSVFSYRQGRHITGIPAQVAGEELERLRMTNNGALTAHAVLEAARSMESVLHGAFPWDDSEAAEQHRLNEARKLIESVQVFSPTMARPVPVHINVRAPEGRSYRATMDVLSDAQLRERALQDVAVALEQLRKKYSSFTDIIEMLNRMKSIAS